MKYGQHKELINFKREYAGLISFCLLQEGNSIGRLCFDTNLGRGNRRMNNSVDQDVFRAFFGKFKFMLFLNYDAVESINLAASCISRKSNKP